MVDKSGSIGSAGEFFVAAELTRRGYVASLTGKNTKAIDILILILIMNFYTFNLCIFLL